MTTAEQIRKLRRLKIQQERVEQEIAQIQDSLKAQMTCKGVDTLFGDDYKVTWKEITTQRFDQKAFKSKEPELYKAYCVASVTRRFVLA